jgi:hypothetical protein
LIVERLVRVQLRAMEYERFELGISLTAVTVARAVCADR